MTTSTSKTGTITCTTYSGSTYIGRKTVGFTLYVPTNVVPSISSVTVTSDDEHSLTSSTEYSATHSKAKYVISATAGSYSSVSQYKVVIDGATKTSTSSTIYSNILTAGNKIATITVTDARGRTASTTETIDVASYAPPTALLTNVGRSSNAIGTPADDGEYLTLKPTFTYNSNFGNTVTSSITIKNLSTTHT